MGHCLNCGFDDCSFLTPDYVCGKCKEKLLKTFVEFWGTEAQILMTIQECSELTKELTEYLIKRERMDIMKIKEEIVDVSIMLDQLKGLFVSNVEFTELTAKKLIRTRNRLFKQDSERQKQEEKKDEY